MKKILVVGGAGYIGSHCVRELQRLGYPTVVLDSLITGHRQAIHEVPLLPIDLQNTGEVKRALELHGPFAGVFHFASFIEVGKSVQDPLSFYRNNVSNTMSLLEAMVATRVPYLIWSSSAAVYGEPRYTPLDEQHPAGPINPYGQTKWMVENILGDCDKAYGIRSCSLRYFNAAGAHPTGDIGEDHHPESHLIPKILQVALAVKRGEKPAPVQIFGNDYATPDGTGVRDYIHVCDLALAHILALKYLEQGGSSDVFNLGNGQGYTVKQVLETCRQVSGVDIPSVTVARRSGDCAVLVASAAKITKVLGWQPQYPSLQDIVKHAWNWHLHHPQGFEITVKPERSV